MKIKVFVSEEPAKIFGYEDSREPDFSEWEGIEVDLPEAQVDWIDECFQSFIDCQEYLKSIYEENGGK